MRVLVACEFSGVVRDAFTALGHDAWSCDLLPTELPGKHLQGDVLTVLDLHWDLMIAFPPCTHLAMFGARWFKDKQQQQAESLTFVQRLMDAPIARIAIENPVGVISSRIRKPDQIIQPYEFGHCESKKTCLWLKRLPWLQPTSIVEPNLMGCKCGCKFDSMAGAYGCPNCHGDKGPARAIYDNQTPTGQNNLGQGPDRWKERSRTYAGIARAFASQWGAL